jgi:predicted aldo/keto reductase-like oxidoreductase
MAAGHRDDFFLATKTEKRTYQEARQELRRSLERLRVDSVDLWQMHILVDPAEWEVAMGPGGALEAFIEARDEGLVRFLGVTGHGVTIAEMHRRSLARFDFDSVLLPYNYAMMQNSRYAADFESLLTLCQERQVAVQTIKSITRGPWGNKSQNRATWYEPLEEPAAIEAAVHWALARPGLFLDTVGDIHILPHVLAAAERFDPAVTQETAEATLKSLEMAPLFV